MMEFLEFAFRDFWTFVGVLVLIYSIGAAGHMIISGLHGLVIINPTKDDEEEK